MNFPHIYFRPKKKIHIFAPNVNFKNKYIMRKFLLTLAAVALTAFAAKADRTVTLDFVGWNFDGAADWGSSYAEHTVNFDDATVYFTKANRQSEGMAISDCPVTKGYDIVVTAKSQIVSTSVLFKQWNTKTKTASIVVDGNTVAETDAFAFENVAIGATSYTISFSETSNQIGLQTITLVLGDGSTPVDEVAAPVITPGTGTYDEPQTVTITADEGCAIYYTLDGTEPNDGSTPYTEPFVVSETTTIKAVAVNAEDTQSKVTTAVITIKSVHSIANTIDNPYTTAEAIALIDDPNADLADSVYVKGVVSNVDSYNSKYHSLTYWLDDKTFEIYSGKGINGEDIESEDYLAANDTVIVYGLIKKYNTIYEMDKNNYIVYYGKYKGEVVNIKNTPETAYTVAKAYELIDAGEGLDEKVYVKGIISSIEEVSPSYGNATYCISDDGTTTQELKVYRGRSVGNEKFTAEDEIKVGDEVIVYGKLVLFGGSTYELASGNYIYSLNGNTQGIKRISEDKETIDLSTAVIYNVLGKRVTDMSKKGIYIVNGKKYVVK